MDDRQGKAQALLHRGGRPLGHRVRAADHSKRGFIEGRIPRSPHDSRWQHTAILAAIFGCIGHRVQSLHKICALNRIVAERKRKIGFYLWCRPACPAWLWAQRLKKASRREGPLSIVAALPWRWSGEQAWRRCRRHIDFMVVIIFDIRVNRDAHGLVSATYISQAVQPDSEAFWYARAARARWFRGNSPDRGRAAAVSLAEPEVPAKPKNPAAMLPHLNVSDPPAPVYD
jgi:hypothetical protein